MKIALFSDVHANLPALEAVLKDLDRTTPDVVYCLGDLVGYLTWPNEVIHAIRERKIPCIAGNYDWGVGRGLDECGCAYKTEEDKAMGAKSISLSNQLIGEDERNYLRNLPVQLNIKHQINEESLSLVLAHGSPRKINEYLFEDREEKSMMRILESAQADILCIGHTHKPYHRIFEYTDHEQKSFRHVINLGSVGKPKDGDNRACYVIVNLDENSSIHNRDSIRVEFVRVPYDVEKAAKAIENSTLPDAYADMLRKAY
jgi:putative phosphoesterase